MDTFSFEQVVNSVEETFLWGSRLGKLLNPGNIVALEGSLGAGKTHFAQGLAKGLEVSGDVQVASPTFVYHQRYQGKHTLHHMDWYRIEERSKLIQLDLLHYLEDDGICVIEWFSKHQEVWLFELFTVKLHHVQKNNPTSRIIHISGKGTHQASVVRALEQLA